MEIMAMAASMPAQSSSYPSDFLLGSDGEQVMLIWTRARSPIYSRLGTDVTREVCHYIRVNVSLFSIYQKSVKEYTSFRKASELREISDSFTGAIFSRINESELLSIGRTPKSAEVSSISLNTLQIRAEEPMKTERNCPGVVKVDLMVYVFGGYVGGTNAKTGEKFNLQTRHWTNIPDMDQCRAYFNPVLYQRNIILADVSQGEKRISTFNVDTETIQVYEVRLDGVKSIYNVCFLLGDSLIILGRFQMAKWVIGSGRVEVTETKSEYSGRSCTEVVVSGRAAIWIDYNNRKPVIFNIRELTFQHDPEYSR